MLPVSSHKALTSITLPAPVRVGIALDDIRILPRLIIGIVIVVDVIRRPKIYLPAFYSQISKSGVLQLFDGLAQKNPGNRNLTIPAVNFRIQKACVINDESALGIIPRPGFIAEGQGRLKHCYYRKIVYITRLQDVSAQ